MIGTALALVSVQASAQETQQPQIVVSATGIAKTAPDMVTIAYNVRGEGTTSDAAVKDLREKAKAIENGARSVAGAKSEFFASGMSVMQIRPKECESNVYPRETLSQGPCAVVGYIATIPVKVDTANVDAGGTLIGLVSRLGGMRANISRFWLRDDSNVRAQAMQSAIADARKQAELIAKGTGVRLGNILKVQDSDYRNIEVLARGSNQLQYDPAPPPVSTPAPVSVDLNPSPIETRARIVVSFAVLQP
ncbi:SIMPL domain-containing protein [Novosphingobium sp. Rr 2-17]|uniref:SIMPL domain-containing protein n=1 Tax=Novosphingobium sp. Rr 2-17 TaxID=555793 RepID=UPI0012F70147|nr:SIMPL domain-containing protein [Novosphingobium sp. Rr 2-17]